MGTEFPFREMRRVLGGRVVTTAQQVTEPTLENGEVAGVYGLDSSNNVSQGNVGRTVVLKVCFLGQQQQHLGTH